MTAAELFTSLTTMYTADSGSGGLNSQSTPSENPAYVRNFFRAGDNNDRDQNWPKIVVEINEREMDPFDRVTAAVQVKFHIYTEANPGFTKQSAVVARFRVKFHNQTPAAGSNWTFSQMSMDGGAQSNPPEDNVLHYVITATLYASAAAGV